MEITKQYVVLGLFRTGRYTVSEQGVLYSHNLKEPLKPVRGNVINGYCQYNLSLGFGSKPIQAYGHQLTYLFYYGAYNPVMVLDHKDHCRHNNHKDNIRVVTPSENVQGYGRTGKTIPYRVRLSTLERAEIVSKAITTSYTKLATDYKVSRQTISNIVNHNQGKTGA